ncbi:Avo2 protein [Martiniozyma asiatica (nom. inval.)]|nr:Avo2 protein [Martiniozyma asiatica]
MSDPSLRLRVAVKENNIFIVNRLLNRFPDLIDNVDPTNGWSNLHYASFHNNFSIAEILLGRIFKRNTKDNKDSDDWYTQITNEDEIRLSFTKQTVIHSACLGNAVDTLPLLLSYFNVCIDQRDEKGKTPTHICCVYGFSDCLNVLLENGAYQDIQDHEGDTPLHIAFQYSHIECIQILLSFNANDKLLNNSGWKPVDVSYDDETISKYSELKQGKKSISSVTSTPVFHTPLVHSFGFRPIEPSSAKSISFFSDSFSVKPHISSPASSKFPLPSILPRKFSVTSELPEDNDDDNDVDVSGADFDFQRDNAVAGTGTGSSTSGAVYYNDNNDIQSTNESKYSFESVGGGSAGSGTPSVYSPLKKTQSQHSVLQKSASNLMMKLTPTSSEFPSLSAAASVNIKSKRYPPSVQEERTNGLGRTSPRRATISSAPTTLYVNTKIEADESNEQFLFPTIPQESIQSPSSKRSSMSARTFRSNVGNLHGAPESPAKNTNRTRSKTGNSVLTNNNGSLTRLVSENTGTSTGSASTGGSNADTIPEGGRMSDLFVTPGVSNVLNFKDEGKRSILNIPILSSRRRRE